jgi:hypothetical protein
MKQHFWQQPWFWWSTGMGLVLLFFGVPAIWFAVRLLPQAGNVSGLLATIGGVMGGDLHARRDYHRPSFRL